jgi:signal transduction histidine kinase
VSLVLQRAVTAGGVLCTLLAGLLFLLGLPLVAGARPGYATYATVTMLVYTVSCFGMAAVVAILGREPLARYAAVMLAVIGGSGSPYTDPLSARPGLFVAARFGNFLLVAFVVWFLVIFPTSRPMPRWAALPFAAWAVATLAVILNPAIYPPGGDPPGILGLLIAAGFFSGVAAQVWRWRKSSDQVARAQTRWVLLGLVIAIVFTLIPAFALPGNGGLTGFVITSLAWLAVPASIAIAVTRYRLWDIDVVINRAVVYGAVTVILVAAYLAINLGANAVFAGRGQTLLSLAAAGLVAVAFQPLRLAVQQVVNRVMYGERDDPRAVLLRLDRAVDESMAGDGLLQRIANTLASALRLPYAAVALRGGEIFSAGTQLEEGGVLSLPLTHQGEAVGELRLAPRGARDPFSPADLELLRELAVHVAVAAQAVELAAELRRSREGLVNARAEERRRLRRDLHDGLGPQLVSLALKLEAERNRAGRDDELKGTLAELAGQTRSVIADVRRLVYALRPPALDELGLVDALGQAGQAVADGMQFEYARPEELPPLPAAVEVAAYRITQEALNNVVRHSGARHCRLALSLAGGGLRVEVSDDGSGIPAGAPAGIGLSSMRERAEELGGRLDLDTTEGGGTRLAAFLPCATDG